MTLDLNGITPASYSFDPPPRPGDYTLDVSGANIANIAPINFTVPIPAAIITPIVIDDDVRIQVAIVDGSTLPDSTTVTLQLDGGRTKTVDLAESVPNPYNSVMYDDLPTDTYALTAAATGLNCSSPEQRVHYQGHCPHRPHGCLGRRRR